MKRIRLSKHEKEVLRLLHSECRCPDTYPLHVFASCADSLERAGLVKCAWNEGHKLEDAHITAFGKEYISLNPSLRNPINWNLIIAVASLAASIVALLVACNMIK